MPQSLARILVHIVYSTKDRRPWLQTEKIRTELYKYKATILRDKVDSPALIIGGVEDHIHALCQLSRKFAIIEVIEKSKTETTKWTVVDQTGDQIAVRPVGTAPLGLALWVEPVTQAVGLG